MAIYKLENEKIIELQNTTFANENINEIQFPKVALLKAYEFKELILKNGNVKLT